MDILTLGTCALSASTFLGSPANECGELRFQIVDAVACEAKAPELQNALQVLVNLIAEQTGQVPEQVTVECKAMEG